MKTMFSSSLIVANFLKNENRICAGLQHYLKQSRETEHFKPSLNLTLKPGLSLRVNTVATEPGQLCHLQLGSILSCLVTNLMSPPKKRVMQEKFLLLNKVEVTTLLQTGCLSKGFKRRTTTLRIKFLWTKECSWWTESWAGLRPKGGKHVRFSNIGENPNCWFKLFILSRFCWLKLNLSQQTFSFELMLGFVFFTILALS